MDEQKKKSIQLVVDTAVSAFAEGLISRYSDEVDDVNGVINIKKNNCFTAGSGEEFMFYSAFVRSFNSSFRNVLKKMGNNIAKLSYDYVEFLNFNLSLSDKQYWNIVCNDRDGFKVVFEQFEKSFLLILKRLNSHFSVS